MRRRHVRRSRIIPRILRRFRSMRSIRRRIRLIIICLLLRHHRILRIRSIIIVFLLRRRRIIIMSIRCSRLRCLLVPSSSSYVSSS